MMYVSAYVAEYGLTIGQVAADAKSNEIPAVQELFKKLQIGSLMMWVGMKTVTQRRVLYN